MGKRLNELRARVKKLERLVGELQRAAAKAKKRKGRKKDVKMKVETRRKHAVARTATRGQSVARANVKPVEKATTLPVHPSP